MLSMVGALLQQRSWTPFSSKEPTMVVRIVVPVVVVMLFLLRTCNATARDDCSYRTGCTTHPFAQHAVIPSPCSFGSHYGYLSVTMQCFPLLWSSFRHHYYIVLLLLLLLLLLLFKWRLVLFFCGWHHEHGSFNIGLPRARDILPKH